MLPQLRQALARSGTDKQPRDWHTIHLILILLSVWASVSCNRVQFIEYEQLRNVDRTDFSQNALNLGDLLRKRGICRIYYMQQQISINRFLQSRLKSVYQTVRKITYESHSVRQRYRTLSFSKVKLARGGVQRGEKLVCCVSSSFNQRIEQRGLPRIGVPNKRNSESVTPFALPALS